MTTYTYNDYYKVSGNRIVEDFIEAARDYYELDLHVEFDGLEVRFEVKDTPIFIEIVCTEEEPYIIKGNDMPLMQQVMQSLSRRAENSWTLIDVVEGLIYEDKFGELGEDAWTDFGFAYSEIDEY